MDAPNPSAPVAVTMGEPAGVGGEITLAAWRALRSDQAPFFVIDDPDRLAALDPATPIRPIESPEAAQACFADALPVLPLGARVRAAFGSPSTATAEAVTGSIEQAARAARAGAASAVVTNPIQKSVLMEAGFAYPGHTEYIAALTADDQNGPDSRPEPVMMIASPALRVVPLSIHVSLRDALTNIETGKIIRTGLTLHAALKQDFGIARPRIAVAGLNPHAGEGGAFGEEEIAQIAPAIAALQAEGVAAIGPLPPDTMFHEEARATYDAALCMYHDQALIPAKTLDFHGGVNVTLGLAIVRTSPDHGVALDLAGTGRARPDSLIAAIRLAGEIAARRAPA